MATTEATRKGRRGRLEDRDVRAIGYVRVSPTGQGDSGAGLDAQRATIRDYVERNGWELLDIVEDVATGANTERPGLHDALARLERGEEGSPEVLIVSKLDRLSRSVVDGGRLFQRAAERGWYIVAPDLSVDTSTANGRLMANLLMTLGQWESDLISERTRDALAAKKAAGQSVGGRRPLPDDVVARIKRWSARGWSASKIARRLNDEGVPTAQGGSKWWPSTVAGVLERTRQRARRGKRTAHR